MDKAMKIQKNISSSLSSCSFVKFGQYMIAIAVILSVLFYSFQYFDADPIQYSVENQHTFSTDKSSKSVPIESKQIISTMELEPSSSSSLNYNELFSNRIDRPPENNKLRMIFVIGFDEYERSVFEYLFEEFAKNNEQIMHISKASDLSKQFEKCWFSESNIEKFCNMAQETLNKMSSNDGFLLISSFIFPFSPSLNIYRFPDMIKLIEMTKNAKPNRIDLKLLILSRDYKKSLIHCVKSKDCNQRILSLSHYLNSLHAQIMQMDKTYFVQINFTHFVQNHLQYDNFFNSLLGGGTKLQNIKLPKDDLLSNDKFHFDELQNYAINESFYSSHTRNRWPLFSNSDSMFNPVQKSLALQTKIDFNKLFSHYHKKEKIDTKLHKKLTMIFIIGVEGVGHHFFRSLFDNLQNVNSVHYIHEPDRPWPQDPLWLIMDQCWAFDVWSKIKEPSWLTVKRSDLKPNERGMRMCDIAQKKINEYSASMSNNSVLFMTTHYSFPYDDPVLNRYPDFVQLIEWAQNAKPSPFNVRLLVLKRDYETSLISTCIKRFGQCTERIFLLANMLNVIHAQLMQIDAAFWIQINYTDFIENVTEYVPILSDFMNVNKGDFERAIEETKKEYKKHKNEKKKKREEMSDEQIAIIHEMYYEQSNKWPLFSNSKYTVSP